MRRPTRTVAGGDDDPILPSTVHQVKKPTSRRKRRSSGSFPVICGVLCLAFVALVGVAFYFLQQGYHPIHKTIKEQQRRRRDYSGDFEPKNRRHEVHRHDAQMMHQKERIKNLIQESPENPNPDNKLQDTSKQTERQTVETPESPLSALPDNSLYRLTTTDIHGNPHELSQYIGKTTLIVNVACECGYTKVNYEQLAMLQTKFASRGFTVLAFPSNDFHQELETNAEILNYIKTNFPQVNFPIMSKSSLSENPIYQTILQKHLPQAKVRWNFGKFLVNGQGMAVKVFDTKQEPLSLQAEIQKLIMTK